MSPFLVSVSFTLCMAFLAGTIFLIIENGKTWQILVLAFVVVFFVVYICALANETSDEDDEPSPSQLNSDVC